MTRKHLSGWGIALAMLAAGPSHATLVSYFLDQTNIDGGDFLDGTDYLRVDIDDGSGDIEFTVTVLGSLTPYTGGIDSFGFNLIGPEVAGFTEGSISVSSISVDAGATTEWAVNTPPPPNNEDGFGLFDVVVYTNGDGERAANTLSFTVSGLATDTVLNYFELALKNNGTAPDQGSYAFVAHVGGFENASAGSGYFGGSTVVPLPAAAWLLLSSLGALTVFRRRRR